MFLISIFLFKKNKKSATISFIQNEAVYSQDGRFVESVTDSLLNKALYEYNQTKGLLTKVTTPNGEETLYTYDNKDRLIKIKQGLKEVNYSYNSSNF